ncbi:MAG: three-Cys-motif partner protein TcmP [Nitrososphaeria archaeon]
MSKKYYDIEKMKRSLNKLVQVGEELSKIESDVYYPARKWSPIKLKLLADYIHLYSNIWSKRRNFCQNFFYIDPLAGAGINKIEDTSDVIAGSPIISVIISENLFNKYFFAESDAKKKRALQSRLEKILSPNQFEIEDDCNMLISHVAEFLSKEHTRMHYLLFVDCEGIEPKWQNMSELLYYPGDLIFVFQTIEVWEQIRHYKNFEGVTKFFGNEEWKKVNRKEMLVDIYKKQVANVITCLGKKRELVDHVPIRGKHFYYDMIFATVKTKEGSPWFTNFMFHAKKIVTMKGDDIKYVLDILKGRSAQLDWYMQSTNKLNHYIDYDKS